MSNEKVTTTAKEDPLAELERIKKMNLYEKLSKITSDLGFVAKNLNVQLAKGGYKAVGEVDVLEAVKPLEHKYRVYSYPYSREISVDKEVEVGQYKTINQFIRVDVVYRFVNIDNPSEFIDIATYGDGIDTGDKAPGKAMTYADKYALLKAYKISTGDDPDQKGSEETKTTKVNKGKTTKEKPTEPIDPTPEQVQLHDQIMKLYDDAAIKTILEFYKVKTLFELTKAESEQVIRRGKENQKKGTSIKDV